MERNETWNLELKLGQIEVYRVKGRCRSLAQSERFRSQTFLDDFRSL